MDEIQTSAAYLYDGGWRKEDMEELMQEYDCSIAEAEKLCAELAEFEKRAKEEEE